MGKGEVRTQKSYDGKKAIRELSVVACITQKGADSITSAASRGRDRSRNRKRLNKDDFLQNPQYTKKVAQKQRSVIDG